MKKMYKTNWTWLEFQEDHSEGETLWMGYYFSCPDINTEQTANTLQPTLGGRRITSSLSEIKKQLLPVHCTKDSKNRTFYTDVPQSDALRITHTNRMHPHAPTATWWRECQQWRKWGGLRWGVAVATVVSCLQLFSRYTYRRAAFGSFKKSSICFLNFTNLTKGIDTR